MAKKRKQKQTENAAPPCEAKRQRDGFYVANFCNVNDFRKKWKVISDKMNEEHHRLIRQHWPFQHFLHMPAITVSRHFILDLFKNWDFDKGGFVYNGQNLYTSDNDFSIILGLMARGNKIKTKPLKTKAEELKSKVCAKFFPGDSYLVREDVEKCLMEQLEPEGFATPKEVISLFTMWFFSMVLFPCINRRVPMYLWEYVDDIEKLWDRAWGPAVHQHTSALFKSVATQVRDHYLYGTGSSPGMQGCAFAMEVMQTTLFSTLHYTILTSFLSSLFTMCTIGRYLCSSTHNQS